MLVPYATLHPTTEQVMKASGLAVEFVHMPDDDAYRRELRERWAIGQTFVIVEQDIVPWPGAIEELHSCMGLWCACAYKLFGGYGIFHSFGCAKFSAELIAKLPSVWDEPCHWSLLDQRFVFAAQAIGETPHSHRPPVIHLGAHAEARHS